MLKGTTELRRNFAKISDPCLSMVIAKVIKIDFIGEKLEHFDGTKIRFWNIREEQLLSRLQALISLQLQS